jgi:hypothetical protein
MHLNLDVMCSVNEYINRRNDDNDQTEGGIMTSSERESVSREHSREREFYPTLQ